MKRWRVFYNTHKYIDRSGTPRASSRFVWADTADDAREVVRDMHQIGQRYIGMVHHAQLAPTPANRSECGED